MSTTTRIAKNVLSLTTGMVISKILLLIITIYIARYLGPVGFGKFSFAFAFTGLFAILANFGFDQLTIREVARDKTLAGKYLDNIIIIKLILSVVTFTLIVLIINLIQCPPDTTLAVYLFGIYVILTSFARFFRSLFRAFERMEYEALLDIIEKIVLISLTISVLILGYGLIEVVSIFVIAGIINFLLSFLVIASKFAKPLINVDFGTWKQLIIAAVPFGLNVIFATIFFHIDTIMLSIMEGDAAVGYYNAAYNPLLALSFIPIVITSSLFPVMSVFFKSSKKKSLVVLSKKATKYLFIIGLPISVGTFILADKFILLIYGKDFVQSVIAFQILAWFIPIRFVSSVFGTVLSSVDKQPLRTVSVAFSAIFNICVNLYLISLFSFIGASIATVLSELILFLLFFYFVEKYSHKLALHKILIKPLIGCLVMGSFIFYLREINIILLIVLAIIIYFLIIHLLKTFDSDDKKIFEEIISKAHKEN